MHPTKKADLACIIGLVSNIEQRNQFALVFIAKKSKKLELVLPVVMELQIAETDSLNFVVFWDPLAFDGSQSSPADKANLFRVRICCNHAGEKRDLIDRVLSIK